MKLWGKIVAAASLLAATIVAPFAHAHGIWFAERARQLALIYGAGADDLDMVRRLPKIQSVAGYDANWRPVPTSLRVAGPIPVVDSEAPLAAVTAVMDNGVWSKGRNGEWHNKGRDELPDAVLSERTMKYTVHLVGALSAGALSRPLPAFQDQTLQIIPVGAIPLEMGMPVTLRVLFQGQPVVGAQIMADFVNDPDQAPLATDARGMVTLPVRNQGLNVIGASHTAPSDQPQRYDHIQHFATLSFVLPHQPE